LSLIDVSQFYTNYVPINIHSYSFKWLLADITQLAFEAIVSGAYKGKASLEVPRILHARDSSRQQVQVQVKKSRLFLFSSFVVYCR